MLLLDSGTAFHWMDLAAAPACLQVLWSQALGEPTNCSQLGVRGVTLTGTSGSWVAQPPYLKSGILILLPLTKPNTAPPSHSPNCC